jgi:hypothetical protein
MKCLAGGFLTGSTEERMLVALLAKTDHTCLFLISALWIDKPFALFHHNNENISSALAFFVLATLFLSLTCSL